MAILPTSALTKFVRNLPDDWTMNAGSARNTLLKQVKQEELDYSGVTKRLANMNDKMRVSKSDLMDWDTNRSDQWGAKQLGRSSTHYDTLTVGDGSDYVEDIRRYNTAEEDDGLIKDLVFSFDDAPKPGQHLGSNKSVRQVSSHFQDDTPNYFSHSRYSTDTIGGLPNTRVIHEIQSDLHQAGRKRGYQGEDEYVAVSNEGRGNKQFSSSEELVEFMRTPEAEGYRATQNKGTIPDAPLKKNWARKEIERQILDAVDQDQKAIAIPLEGGGEGLSRSSGVQKWYETQVRATMKKIANKIPGAEYKEVIGKTDSFDLRDGAIELMYDLVTAQPDIMVRGQAYFPNWPEDLDVILELVHGNDELFAVLTREQQAAVIAVREAEPIKNALKALTYGQIILPKSEKIPGGGQIAKQITVPKYKYGTVTFEKAFNEHYADNWEELEDHAQLLLYKYTPEADELSNYTIEEASEYIQTLLPKERLKKLVPGLFEATTKVSQVSKTSTVWPELTPEIREVFKRWETPPATLEELNKLRKELPGRANETIQSVASTSALQARFGDLEDLKLAINKSTGVYKSVFDSPDIVEVLDHLHPRDIETMSEGLTKKVEEALTVINDPKVVIKFMEKHWDTIAKEQSLPKVTTKVTPATYRYPEWTKKFELYSAGGLAIAASTSSEDAEAGAASTIIDNLMATMPSTASARIKRLAAESAVESQIHNPASTELTVKELIKKQVDPTAHTARSFSKLGEGRGSDQALAAHSFRGGLGYMISGDVFDSMSDREFLNAVVTQRELLKLADTLQDVDSELVGKLSDRAEDLSELLGEYTSVSQMEARLEGSKLVLDKPLYITRWHSQEGVENDKHLYSALVINPGQIETYASAGQASSVYKLPKGSEVYHPFDMADRNEVVVRGATLNTSPSTSTNTYLAKLAKNAAPFTMGGIAVSADSEAQEALANDNDPVGKALNQGASPGAILEHLQTNEGLDEDQARRAIAASIQSKIDSAIEQGASSEAVQNHVLEAYGDGMFAGHEFSYKEETSEQVEFPFPEEELKGWAEPEYVPVATDPTQFTEASNEALIAAKENMLTSYQFMMEDLGTMLWGNEESQVRFNKMNKTNRYAIANTLRSMGRNVEWDDEQSGFVEIREDGARIEITPDWYSKLMWGMVSAKGEIGLGVSGALAAGTLSKAIPIGKTLPGKLLGWATRLGVTTAGGSTGVALGRGLDLAYDSAMLGEQLEAEYYKRMMIDAGYWDAVIAGSLAIGGAALYKTIIDTGKAAKMVVDGNRAGAYRSLKKFMHLNDDQVDEIIKEWETVTGVDAPGITRTTKALHVVPQTQPGGEAIVSSAAGMNPNMSSDLVKQISNRAKDLNNATKHLTTGNVSTVVHNDLAKYVTKVKDFYSGVKSLGTAPFKDSAYRFTFDKLGIDKVLEDTGRTIANKAKKKQFEAYVDVIETLSNGRTFKDLLDLRKTLNEFKYNTRLRQHIDWKMVNGAIHNVDKEISKAAHKHMPAGDVWLKEWAKANQEYSTMIKLRKNVLYKVLTRKGVDHKVIVKSLAKYVNSLDGTFMDVVSRLPPNTRKKVEGTVLNELAKKHTVGFESGIQATHFTNLAEELKTVPFSSIEARHVKRAVNSLARVFKNDVDLAAGTGQIARPKFQSYLTTDPVVRAKYEIASSVFNYIKRLAPTSTGDYIALVTKTAKILENPADSKTIAALIKTMPDDPSISTGLHQLALVSAKFGEKTTYPNVVVYKSSRQGKAHRSTDGKLGTGVYWSTDRHSVKAVADNSGQRITKEEVLPTRIATEADIKRLLNIDEVTPKIIKESDKLQSLLQAEGYDGLAIGHDVLIFKE